MDCDCPQNLPAIVPQPTGYTKQDVTLHLSRDGEKTAPVQVTPSGAMKATFPLLGVTGFVTRTPNQHRVYAFGRLIFLSTDGVINNPPPIALPQRPR